MVKLIFEIPNVFDVVEDSKKREIAEQNFNELIENETTKNPPRKRQY